MKTACVMGLAICLSGQAFAQTETKPVPTLALEAPCKAFGAEALCTTVWTAGKHASHRVQDYAIRSAETGAVLFSGRGLYRIRPAGGDGNDGRNTVDGYWADSQGSVHKLVGTWNGTELAVTWGSPETEQGRSRYVFSSDGGITVEDWVLRTAGWQMFMAVEYPATGAE